jgi:hypothetical protein
MRFSPVIAARLATLVLLSAGAGPDATAGILAKKDPAAPYLGMSVTDILACAGEPHSRFESGPGKETLVFRYTGAGPVPAEKPRADDKKSKADKKSADKKSADTKSDSKTSDDTKSDDKTADAKPSGGKKTDDKKSDNAKSDDNKPDTGKLSSIFGKNKKKAEPDWTCSASLVFEDGKLARVTIAHKGVHSPYDWQAEKDPVKQEEKRKEGVPTCDFSLPKCAR